MADALASALDSPSDFQNTNATKEEEKKQNQCLAYFWLTEHSNDRDGSGG